MGNSAMLEDLIFRPRYLRSQMAHLPHLPSPDPLQARILEDLGTHGIAMTSLDELAINGSSELLASAKAVSEILTQLARLPENSGRHTIQATSDHLMAHPAIFRWGLADWILKLVECYLGLPVGYDGFSFYYSVADGRVDGPRQWHRDREDRRMLKVALYVSDVDDQGGPFQTIPPEVSRLVGDPQRFNYQPLTESEVVSRLPSSTALQPITCEGPAGTIFLADTAQYFHRGKPPITADRSAIFFSYFARPPRHPFLCHRSPFSTRQIKTLVADLTPKQRAAALWDQNVSMALRWIPKNFIKV